MLSDENNSENVSEEKTEAQEDEYLPIVIVEGAVDEIHDDAYNASATWDTEKIASLPILDTDVSSASDGCILLGLPGEYIAAQQAVLDRINEIRKEACDEGVTNPETGKPLTSDDYVALKWSKELEQIARIRAAESAMTAYHKRTNGESWQSMDSEYWYVGECVAWNYGRSATSGIEQWYAEKKYWLDGNENDSGHYTTLIRPAMRHVGAGTFYSPYTQYPNATLVEFYTEEGLDDSFVDMTGECIQTLEVAEANLSGAPSMIGIFSGVKGDEQQLYLTTNAQYSGAFTANTKSLLFLEGVDWATSDIKIASFSSDGVVKAGNCGRATINATAENGSSATEEFTVDHVLQTIPAVAATCTETGLTEGEKCVNCGTITVEQETVAAKGHSWSSWNTVKKATCTTKGSKERVCANCGKKETAVIKATGHKWNTEYTIDKPATPFEEGSESIHCSVCGVIDESTIRTIPILKGEWVKNSKGWWYKRGDGTYPAGCKEEIDGKTYCFDDAGYRKTGWQQYGGEWYYFDGNGVMQTGWLNLNGKWYYLGTDGMMQTGLQKIGAKQFYFAAAPSGVMQTGWQKISGSWYYFAAAPSGAMVTNSWVGNYYLTDSGKMAVNQWIGSYYVGSDGKWIPGYKAAN